MFLLIIKVFLIFDIFIQDCSGDWDQALRPVNCESNTFGYNDCGGIRAPFANTDETGTSYPSDGFCIVKNITQGIDPGVVAYHFEVPICSGYGDFGGGIFFNYQDEQNYDVFYTYSEYSSICILGYVEMGTIHNSTSFSCKLGKDMIPWWEFGIDAGNGSARATLGSYRNSLEPVTSHQFAPHFSMTPVAGPLHINSDGFHVHLHIGNSTMHTITCADSPELCNPCDFAYNVQSQPMYPLPDYRNFLLWYPRALEMVYTSCYFKVMLEQADESLINATSKVGTFSHDSLIKVGDLYGERHACITNQAACLQVKSAGSVTDGQEINQDRTLIVIKPKDTTDLKGIEVNAALEMIYGDSIVSEQNSEFSMHLDERVYGQDFGIYCHSSKSVYEAETVSENMCLNGNNNGNQPPEGGILQKGWAVRFY